MARDFDELELDPPYKGVYRGEAGTAQPKNTTDDLRNIRAISANNKRQISKRPGLVKAFPTQLGLSATTRRINAIAILRFAAAAAGCVPRKWANVKAGLLDATEADTSGNRIMGWNPSTLLHVIGEFTDKPNANTERWARFNTLPLQEAWDSPNVGFDVNNGIDWPCQLLESSVDGEVSAGVGFLYVVGGRRTLPSVIDRFGRWTGADFNNLAGSGINGAVHAIAEFNGSLYIAGNFTTANGVACARIARWDHVADTFVALGAGFNAAVYALEVFNGELYAAGDFTQNGAGAGNFPRIAKWTGAAWVDISGGGAGFNAAVWALRNWNGKLYIGGEFVTWNATANFNMMASWDGTTMSPLVYGLRSRDTTAIAGGVYVMNIYQDGVGEALWVAGKFQQASNDLGGGISTFNVARWSGSEWAGIPLGLGYPEVTVSNTVRDIKGIGNAIKKILYACGTFKGKNLVAGGGILSWDGEKWRGVGGAGLQHGHTTAADYKVGLEAATLVDSDGVEMLFVAGGWANNIHGFGPGAIDNQIAGWNGYQWLDLDGGVNNTVRVLAKHDDGSGMKLYAGGAFTVAGQISASRIAAYTGSEWEALGTGAAAGDVLAIFAFTPAELYVGGAFTSAGGVANTDSIARWARNATTGVLEWQTLKAGMAAPSDDVLCFAKYNGKLIIGGKFSNLDGQANNDFIAEYDTVAGTFAPLSTGMNGTVRGLAVLGDELYAVGDFTTAGGTAVNRIARWNGTTWQKVHTGLDARGNVVIMVQEVSGDNLYIGGAFTKAGQAQAIGIVRFDGSKFSIVDDTNFGGVRQFQNVGAAEVQALTVYNGRLVAMGSLCAASGSSARRIARAVCGEAEDLINGQDPGFESSTGGAGTDGGEEDEEGSGFGFEFFGPPGEPATAPDETGRPREAVSGRGTISLVPYEDQYEVKK